MNLYLITQTENTGYDTADSAVVVAFSEQEAKKINPRYGSWHYCAQQGENASWATSPDNVKAEYIGASWGPRYAGDVVLCSFNAG